MNRRPPPNWRPGMVLVLVLIVVAMLTLAGYSFSELMFIEHKAARLAGRGVQVQAVVESAGEAVLAYLDQPRTEQASLGGHHDNPAYWQGVTVLDDQFGAGEVRFSLVSPPGPDDEGADVRFGLTDESSRLNLAAILVWETHEPGAGRSALLQLPGMTVELADALLDWMDADDEPRATGAESEYYGRLEPPVTPANALPVAIDELLLVRGVTRGLLLGDDANRNGRPDAEEQATRSRGMGLSSPLPAHGWEAQLTLYSAESNSDQFGQPRIQLNDDDLPALHRALAAEFDRALADFVIHLRQFGPAPPHVAAGASRSPPAYLSLPGEHRLASPWDLIGALVAVRMNDASVVVSSPLRSDRDAMRGYLPRVLDRLTASTARTIIGRVNVNAAPRAVLAGIPGIDLATVDEIIAKRRPAEADDPLARHAAWLVLDDVVDVERMRSLWPYVTGGGDVYRGQLLASFDAAGPRERVEFVADATTRPARLVFWRDLKALGSAYGDEVLAADPLGSAR